MSAHFDADGNGITWSPSWNITPNRRIPVILQDQRPRRHGLMRWGWNPAALRGKLLVNCRGEEAYRKPLFIEALHHRRCLIPATLFYEWRPASVPKGKPSPYAFAPTGGGLFAIAGLWHSVTGEDGVKTGEVIIMTVPANPIVAPVHDRMPLVIDRGDAAQWLQPGDDGLSLITTPPAAAWRTWPIGTAIGNVKRDGPEITAPMETGVR